MSKAKAAESLMSVAPVCYRGFAELSLHNVNVFRQAVVRSNDKFLAVVHPTQGGRPQNDRYSDIYFSHINSRKHSSRELQSEKPRVNNDWNEYVVNLLGTIDFATKQNIPILWILENLVDFQREEKIILKSIDSTMRVIGEKFFDTIGPIFFYPSMWAFPSPVKADYNDSPDFLVDYLKLLKRNANTDSAYVVGQQFNIKSPSCVSAWSRDANKAGISTKIIYNATYSNE